MENNKLHTCCFFGHRKITVTDELINRLEENIEKLIAEKGIDTFLFGSKSQFDRLCLSAVTKLKEKYPHIRRIYVRAEFPYIDEDYRAYLLQQYEDTYYPMRIINAGKAVYIERNYEMIDNSNYCIIYYDENYQPSVRMKTPQKPSSGTKRAYEYAKRKHVCIVNVWG